jgi:opacity protein-like surface antigen
MLPGMRLHSLRRVLWVAFLGSAIAPPTLAQVAQPMQPQPLPQQMQPQPISPYVPPPPPPRRFALSVFGGWTTNSDVSGSGGTLRIGDAGSFGAAFGVRAPGGVLAELKWIYFDPEAQFSSLGSTDSFHIPTNYFLLSGEKGIRRDRAEPFLWGGLGTAVFSPGSFNVYGTHYSPGTTWRFAFGLGGGVRVYLNERIAVRLGIEMLAPVLFSGTSLYVGTGGSGLGVSGGIPTVTGNFTAGITIVP